MTREEAINEIKSWDFLEGKEIEVIHTLIPELKESEDERIRKWIKKEIEDKYVVEGIVNNKLADEAFGWLEKQKHLYETTKDRFYSEGFEEGQLYERQKESLHISETCKENANSFTDEDERIRTALCDIVRDMPYMETELRAHGLTVEQALAYLEKQKDASKAIEAVERIDKYIKYVRAHTSNAHDMDDSNPNKGYYSGVDDTLSNIAGILNGVYSEEKQKEQKPSTEETELNSIAFLEQMGYTCIPPKEQKPILEVFGFKVGDAVRLKDGDGRKHIIKSFEEVEGLHGPNFYHVEFEDNSARTGIYPGEEYPNGYYTQMEKFKEEQKPAKIDEDIELGLDRALMIVKDAKGALPGYQSDDGIYECDHAIRTLTHILKNGIEQKPNIELIQRSWYMEGYNDRKFGKEPKWVIKTGDGGPKYEENPKYGQMLEAEQKPEEKLSKEEYVKRFKALCDAYEIKLPNREYDIYHLCDDLSKLSIDSDKQKPEEKPINWTELTWKDINELEGIINKVHYEFRNGIGQESFGKEVLEQFREYKGDEYLDGIEQKPAEWVLPEDFEEAVYKVANFISPFNSQDELRRVSHRFAEQLMSLAKKEMDKPAKWSENDNIFLNEIIDFFENGTVKLQHDLSMYAHWLKSLPERFNLEPKQEWSEEDEVNLGDIKCALYNYYGERAEELYNMLKSLRPQPKKELSIEKAIQWLDDTFYFLDNSSGRGRDCEITTHDFDSLEEMYDSFRKAVIVDSEPSWKPSEEQMEAFSQIVQQFKPDKELESLYEDLQKKYGTF